MISFKKSQKGQAIVLIALAIVGLLGITALAIDAGNGFADERHAQLAADNAALAGALAKANETSASYAAQLITARNGFDAGTMTLPDQVEIFDGAAGGPFTNCKDVAIDPVDHSDPDDSLAQYVQVKIHSHVNTYFGPIVGINKVAYCVYAIARAEPSKWDSDLMGQAIAAMDCHIKDAITIGNNNEVIVIGGGIFSNSDHMAESLLVKSGESIGFPKPGLTAVGKITAPSDFEQHEGVEQLPCEYPEEALPPAVPDACTASYNTFPPHASDENVNVNVDPVEIKPGVYCISKTFNNPNMTGEDVTFVLLPGAGVSWSGNPDYVHLKAPSDPLNPWNGILIYAPPDNHDDLVFNGSASMEIIGSILAPGADIKMTGTFAGSSVSQWIGRTVEFGGTFEGTITYNDSVEHKYVVPPHVQLTK